MHKAETCAESTECGCGHTTPRDLPQGIAEAPASGTTRVVRIPAMDCLVEEGEIRHALSKIAGIKSLRFDLGARTLEIDASPESFALAVSAIGRAGFKSELAGTTAQLAADACCHDDHCHEHDASHSREQSRSWVNGLPRGLSRYALSLALALAAETIAYFAPDSVIFTGLGMSLAAAAIALAGLSTYAKGLSALRHLRLNINALMTVAVTGAFLIGQWPEAAMVMALYAIAELIEARAVERARNAVKSLLAMKPTDAEVRQAAGTWERLAADSVVVGSTVRIRPGERIPLDGVVLNGQSAVDQSSVTGESLPADKSEGDEVFAGTVNQTGALEIRVTARASDSTLARIIHAVESAQASRAPTQRFVDRFAAAYTPCVFLLAVAVALLTPWAMGWGWMTSVYKALVLLVIACPCALVISTPVTVVSGLAAAARRGILIKGGAHLESARGLRAVAIDKTGTLTEGRPRQVAREILDTTLSPADIDSIARSLALRSDHPVSRAIAQGTDAASREVKNFEAVGGRGVRGQIDGLEFALANHRWVDERGQCSAEIKALMTLHESAGRSVTVLCSEGGALALFAVADTIRESTAAAVKDLKRLGVTPVMLSGDNQSTARSIASQAGIEEVRGDLLPDDKMQAVVDLKRRFGFAGMVGDGINDAPALARADVGFAMGAAGTHTAMEAADIVIMNDDLGRVPETILLSRRTHAILWQNILIALGIKTVFLLLAIFDNATMWMAVFADMGASLLVVLNGLRLLKGLRR